MKTVLALALSLFLTTAASAQSYIYQSGNVTPNHAVRWITNGIVGDAGTAANGFLSSIGVLAQGPGLCQQSAAPPSPYNQLCLGVNTAGAATISLQNYGGAAAQNLNFVINGVTYPFPYTIGGIVGPSTSTVGDLVAFNNTTGSLAKDTGLLFNTSGSPLDGQTYTYVAQNSDWEQVEPWPVPNKFALRSTYTQLANMQVASPVQLNALMWGDSVAGAHAANLIGQLGGNLGFAGAFGCLANLPTGAPVICVTSNSTSGTVTPITGDFAHFPTGNGESLTVGACQVYGQGGGYAVGNSYYVFYIAEPGAGTITLSTNLNGAGFVQQAQASAANASTIGAVIDVTGLTVAPYTWEVCASGAGPVKIWAGGFINTAINGVVFENVANGGIALSDMLYTPSAVTTPWYTVLNPSLVTFEMKNDMALETPPCATRVACLNSFISTWTSINAEVDFLLLGSPPVNPAGGNDATQISYNNALRSVAIANNAFYWDGYYPALNYATEIALGWITNGSNPHQTTLGQAAESNLLWSMSGLGSLINSAVSNPINNTTINTVNLTVGTPSAFTSGFGAIAGTATITGGINALLTVNTSNLGVGTAAIDLGYGAGGGLGTASILQSSSGMFFNSHNNPFVFGGQPSATPTAQTIEFQNGVGTNIAGVNSTIICGGLSTGTGTDGDCIIQTGIKNGSSGTGAPTPTTALTIKGETQNLIGASTAASTTTSTGALVLAGGLGIAGAINAGGAVNAVGASLSGQLITTYGTPTIASGACGATTNGSIASGGTNQSGEVQIGAATTTTCTISFSTTLGAAPLSCTLTPANAAAAAWGTTVARVSSISTSAWVITGSALANANYYYTCI
jgi:hypothetical protein